MAFSRSTADIIYDNSKFHLTNGIKMWIIIKYYRFATLAQLAEHLIRNVLLTILKFYTFATVAQSVEQRFRKP